MDEWEQESERASRVRYFIYITLRLFCHFGFHFFLVCLVTAYAEFSFPLLYLVGCSVCLVAWLLSDRLIHWFAIFTQASNFGPADWRARPPRPTAALAHPRSGCPPSVDSVEICMMSGRWSIYKPSAPTANTTERNIVSLLLLYLLWWCVENGCWFGGLLVWFGWLCILQGIGGDWFHIRLFWVFCILHLHCFDWYGK